MMCQIILVISLFLEVSKHRTEPWLFFFHWANSTDLKVPKYSNVFQVHSVECVFKIKPILSIMFYAMYGAVYIPITHYPSEDWDNKCTLSDHHHKVWIIFLCLESWNNGMSCMSFYVLLKNTSEAGHSQAKHLSLPNYLKQSDQWFRIHKRNWISNVIEYC